MDPIKLSDLFYTDKPIRDLVSLYCSNPPSAEALSDWFKTIDFEALWMEQSYMAAQISATLDYTGAPQPLVPRLKGVLKYVHTLNSTMGVGLYRLGGHLAEKGISMILLRETALYFAYPELPHFPMWHLELGIPVQQYAAAKEVAANAGFTVNSQPHCTEVRMDKAQKILLYPCQEEDIILYHAADFSLRGLRCRIPSRETLAVNLAQATARMMNATKSPGMISRLLLIRSLLGDSSDWAELTAIAAKYRCRAQLRLVLEGVNHMLPGSVEEQILDAITSHANAEQLADAILELRDLKPRANRLYRMWLFSKMDAANHPEKTAVAFCRRLRHAAGKRLFPSK